MHDCSLHKKSIPQIKKDGGEFCFKLKISHEKLEDLQNFLYNDKLAWVKVQLIEISNIDKGDIVIEIGPGTGIITKQLAKKMWYGLCNRNTDPYLCKKLKKMFCNIENKLKIQ